MDSLERADGLTRRQALRLLGGGALALGTLGLTGCGTSLGGDRLASTDFGNAAVRAMLRRSFITEHSEMLDQQTAAFNTDLNVEVELLHQPDWREQYRRASQERQGADLAEFFSPDSQIHADRLVDVSQLAEEIGAANGGWLDIARTVGTADGRWVAIPWSLTPSAITYRMDLVEQVGMGPPDTYDDLLELATRLRDNDLPLAGFSMSPTAPNDSANFAYSLLWAFGAQEIDPVTGKVALDSQATRDALAYFRRLSELNAPAAPQFDEGGNNEAFLNGEISMTQNTSSIYWRARAEFPKLAAVTSHSRYPAGPAGLHQLVEVNSLGIFAHSRHQAAAKEWVRFICQPDQLRPLSSVALSSLIPPLASYQADPAMPWNTDPHLSGMVGIGSNSHLSGWPGPPSAESAYVLRNGTIVSMFSEVAAKRIEIDPAVATACEALKRVYET